ncbi:MAG: hypothetical protein OEL57_14945 [Trichlorobacter sp.]|uniref:hypothetical protein n=1 Tax=Trichlorobacter sp. TaxID=2911007 RepID=UPI002563BCB6|nr:hypothetical protein [Trichlorobacter sp.]MDK9719181.1 hypothetical protein [Trichlorobacter sp.]
MQPTTTRLFFLFLVVAVLSGCAVVEKVLLVPEEDGKVSYSGKLTKQQVFKTVGEVAEELKIPAWSNEITYSNLSEGIIETGNFSKTNVMGIRLKAQVYSEKTVVEVTVKGVGPYYSKLALKEALNSYMSVLQKRLTEQSIAPGSLPKSP